jgi:hypothetical protein
MPVQGLITLFQKNPVTHRKTIVGIVPQSLIVNTSVDPQESSLRIVNISFKLYGARIGTEATLTSSEIFLRLNGPSTIDQSGSFDVEVIDNGADRRVILEACFIADDGKVGGAGELPEVRKRKKNTTTTKKKAGKAQKTLNQTGKNA